MGSRRIVCVFVGLGLLTACTSDDDPEPPSATLPADITVTSTAFGDGDPIPVEFTCDGSDVPPPLAWSGVPDDAEALALVADDPDAPDGTFTHWVLVDLPLSVASINADMVLEGVIGNNTSGQARYTGPCPPEDDDAHTYRFTVYALDAPTGLENGAEVDEARHAISEAAISYGVLTGIYDRRS